MRRRSASAVALWLMFLVVGPAQAHDIPNAQVDRSTQATLRPGQLEIDYEVSLAELTLTQDLRALTGSLPGSDRQTWFARYGKVTGPLNAKGFLIAVDGRPVRLSVHGYDLAVEEHPRYTFHFVAEVPEHGRLVIHDTNYAASEGTSRLALRGADGVTIQGNDLPGDVREIPIRPVWQLSDAEERRTKQLEVTYRSAGEPVALGPPVQRSSKPSRHSLAPPPTSRSRPLLSTRSRLSGLLDHPSTGSWLGIWLVALLLGSAHAIQPGHGKTLVAATAVGESGGWLAALALALIVTVAHMSGVLAVAFGLWATRSTRYQEINTVLAQVAGFAIAAIGLWRLGRHLGRHGEHPSGDAAAPLPGRSLLTLGLAGGLVPCWDAVLLIILAEAIGRLRLGLVLLAAFSLGMALVLVMVGLAAAHVRSVAVNAQQGSVWERRFGLTGGLALTAIGLLMMA